MILHDTMARRTDEEDVLPLLIRHEIQVLRRAGHSQVDVAERTGQPLSTVRRIEREPTVAHADDAAERKARGIGRPSKTQEYNDKVRAWLADEPELPTLELLRRAREAGYKGQKSSFYTLVSALRPSKAAPIVRFEGLPGEFSQHDFGEVVVRYVSGSTERIHFFASRLKYSRYSAVNLVPNQRVEVLVRSLARHFVVFGGRPLMAVFDRPKTIVTRGGVGRAVEQWNATFAQAMIDLGVGVEISAPRSGQQKGSVERIVGWVKNSFFKCRKFIDRADLEAQLAAWLVEINTRTASRATGIIPETRRQEELPRLRPNKLTPETLALRIPIVVGPTAEVQHEGVRYMMPPETVHLPGTLFLYEKKVHIDVGRHQLDARRRTADEPMTATPAQRSAKIAAVHGRRAKLYEKRQQLLDLGGDVLPFLTDITHRAPFKAGKSVEQLHGLLLRHGDDCLRAAFTSVVKDGAYDVLAVELACASYNRAKRGKRS